jgi:hypothetical protein
MLESGKKKADGSETDDLCVGGGKGVLTGGGDGGRGNHREAGVAAQAWRVHQELEEQVVSTQERWLISRVSEHEWLVPRWSGWSECVRGPQGSCVRGVVGVKGCVWVGERASMSKPWDCGDWHPALLCGSVRGCGHVVRFVLPGE